jgi:Tol biopolymer transport system component
VLLLRLLAAAALAAAALPSSAPAAPPGENGPFFLSLNKCSSYASYLARMPSRGGELTALTPACDDNQGPTAYRDVRSPEASPNGRRIVAFQQATDLSGFLSLNPDGTDQRLMPVAPSDDFQFSWGMHPSFAPDGNRFVFDDATGRRLWRGRLTTGSVRVLHEGLRCGRRYMQLEWPRWSPDGKLIALRVGVPCKRRTKPNRTGIWLMRVSDGKFIRRLAGGHVGDMDWSPTGRQLVYATSHLQRESEGGASGGNLYIVSRRGGKARKLVHRHHIAETNATWSPDGRWIAWVSLEYGAGDVGFDVEASIWRVRATGGRLQRLAALPDPYVEEGDFHAPELTWLPQ